MLFLSSAAQDAAAPDAMKAHTRHLIAFVLGSSERSQASQARSLNV